jgi:hypothetical protein
MTAASSRQVRRNGCSGSFNRYPTVEPSYISGAFSHHVNTKPSSRPPLHYEQANNTSITGNMHFPKLAIALSATAALAAPAASTNGHRTSFSHHCQRRARHHHHPAWSGRAYSTGLMLYRTGQEDLSWMRQGLRPDLC